MSDLAKIKKKGKGETGMSERGEVKKRKELNDSGETNEGKGIKDRGKVKKGRG